MIVRVGLLDKSDNYISRLANYQNVHSNEAVQFEIYLFTEEQINIKMYIPMKRYSLKFIFLRKNRWCADRWDAAGE